MKRIAVVVALSMAVSSTAQAEPQETPLFEQDVVSGNLPRVDERLPSVPEVAKSETIGNPGGELRMLMGGPKDTRMMVVYGYARLVGYTPALKLVPDILASMDVQDGRIFTFHLRSGHKWSDGYPLTSEDFRYWFEDVAQNNQLSPSGLPVSMMVQGVAPRFEVLDDTTIATLGRSRTRYFFLISLGLTLSTSIVLHTI